MKPYQFIAAICLFAYLIFPVVSNVFAQESLPGFGIVVRVSTTNAPIMVAGSTGNVFAISRHFHFEHPRKPEHSMWPDELVSVYVPATGIVWTGRTNDCHLAMLEGCIIGFAPITGSSMRASISTNRYTPRLTNVDEVFKAERDFYCDLIQKNGFMEPYLISVRGLFESLAESVLERVFSNSAGWGELRTGVFVEGTNAVITFQIETNLVAKVAFNSKLEPVWATTNGIPFRAIRTNTVFLIDGHAGPRTPTAIY